MNYLKRTEMIEAMEAGWLLLLPLPDFQMSYET
jgi:hypothetical protein